MKVYGDTVFINHDISFDSTWEQIVAIENLTIVNGTQTIEDSLNSHYVLKTNKNYNYLYLLDTLPNGFNWEPRIAGTLSWSRANLTYHAGDSVDDFFSGPCNITNTEGITEEMINNLIREANNLLDNKVHLDDDEIELLMKKLYLLNLRCCIVGEDEKINAAYLLWNLDSLYSLNESQLKLKEKFKWYNNFTCD